MLYKPLVELIKTRKWFVVIVENMEEANKIAGLEKKKEINLNVQEEADFEQLIDDQLSAVYDMSDPLSKDDEVMLTCDGIRAQIASLNTVFEPSIFSVVLMTRL